MKERNSRSIALALVAIALSSSLGAAVPARAEQYPTGLFIGLTAGFGGSVVEYEDGRKNVSEDPIGGGMGGMRIGYGVCPKLAISLEGHGFGRGEDGDDEWGIGAGFLAVTWRPRADGFFVRAGGGLGGGDYTALDSEEKVEIEERFAWLFEVGYDWRLGEHTSLGLAATSFGLDAGGTTGYDDDGIGAAGITAQFTWHP